MVPYNVIGVGRQELLAVKVGLSSWEEWEEQTKNLKAETERVRAYYQTIKPQLPEPMAKEAFIGKAGEFVEAVRAAGTEACKEALLISFLIPFGSIIGRKPYRHQSAPHRANEFAVLVGDTSSAKGIAWEATVPLLELIDQDWVNNRVQSGLESGQAVIDKVRDPSVQHSRGKSVAIPGVSDKRLLIFEEEFARILVTSKWKGSVLSEILRCGWDGRQVLWSSSKSNSQRATGAHISLFGHITPLELRKNLSEIDSTNGFANRILWFLVHSEGAVAVPPLVNWHGNHPDLIKGLREIVENFRTRPSSQMQWSRDGRDEWDNYHRAAKKRSFGGLLGPIVKRSVPHVLRLTMIYTLLDNSCLMKPKHLAAAIAVVDYAERSAKAIFGQQTGNKDADKLLWHLERAADGIDEATFLRSSVAPGPRLTSI
jgi:Protein of unknown function (DUF3987)